LILVIREKKLGRCVYRTPPAWTPPSFFRLAQVFGHLPVGNLGVFPSPQSSVCLCLDHITHLRGILVLFLLLCLFAWLGLYTWGKKSPKDRPLFRLETVWGRVNKFPPTADRLFHLGLARSQGECWVGTGAAGKMGSCPTWKVFFWGGGGPPSGGPVFFIGEDPHSAWVCWLTFILNSLAILWGATPPVNGFFVAFGPGVFLVALQKRLRTFPARMG